MPPVAQTPGAVTHGPDHHTGSASGPMDTHNHYHNTPAPAANHHHTHTNGGGGDGRDNSGGSGVSAPPAANGHASNQPIQQQPQQQQQQQAQQKDRQANSAPAKKTAAQKGQVSFALHTTEITLDESQPDANWGHEPSHDPPTESPMRGAIGIAPWLSQPPDSNWLTQDNLPPTKQQRASEEGPNDLFFGGGGGDDKSSGLSLKDREERLRQLRDRQQLEKQQKLEELKEHAAAAQRFREQQENERRRRLEEMRMRDADRRSQVEERKKIIQQAEQDRREAVLRKNYEREQRMESKRRNERSSIVFAFGSSTPRMLDPKDNSSSSYWATRRATSTTNMHMADGGLARRASECCETDLSRKRATSAHGLDRKPEDLRMSSSMYEVFHWDEGSSSRPHQPPTTKGTRLTKSRDSSLERKTPPSALNWVRSSTPQPPQSSTSSSSPDKTPTNASQSRFCVWEFGDNFTALGPANQSSVGGGGVSEQAASPSPASTPTSSTCYSRRTASVFTGAGCTVGEDLMTRSMTAAIPTTAARRRTDLMPAMPSLRDATTSRSSPRHRSPGMRSGTVTPNSPSRPTSALSQGSTNSSQVSYRPRTSPRKPRPLSIAGSSLSSADKPRDFGATEPREGRPVERKLSVGSASSVTKPTRAKSAGSDRSQPSTPARTPAKPATPKKTPAQVKAESAAKKAAEKSKSTPKSKVTPKTTPLQSPSVESKPLAIAKSKKASSPREGSTVEEKPDTPQAATERPTESAKLEEKPTEPEQKPEVKPEKPEVSAEAEKPPIEESTPSVEPPKTEEAVQEPPTVPATKPAAEPTPVPSQEDKEKPTVEDTNRDVAASQPKTEEPSQHITEEKQSEAESQEDPNKSMAQKAAEKPVTGYASEEEYKAALAEKRRLAREAKEREQELERQKLLEEEERERREEEEYLRLIEEQRKAEEERLKKAIEEADRQREEEAKRKEEEDKQRAEAERIEQQKREEAEVRLKKEEEERQARKSRVAAIMARTRGKGGSNTPTKNEAKTPSEDGKNFGDGLMSTSMSDSMTNSMIAELESAAAASEQEGDECKPDITESESESITASQTVTIKGSESTTETQMESLVSGVSAVKLEEFHVNGDTPVPMDTTPTHTVDLLGSLSDVNSVNLNGVDNNSTSPQASQGRTDNFIDSLDPLNSSLSTSTSSTTTTTTTTIISEASNFEQIIDLGQTKLSNEDAVNSNPTSPFIAFEQNLNKKPNQENTSAVPDLLL